MDVDEPLETGAAQELTRAEGLWFEDCGLIIQAETTLFRVSRDFLAARSTVFQDMLSLPTPKDADRMEGCPFVHLPDSAEDLTYFLKALLDYEFFGAVPAMTTFPILAGILRMSHKYEVDGLRKRALVHLSTRHPMTLWEWESSNSSLSWNVEAASSVCTHLEIILLARQISAPWILPVAFYNACMYLNPEAIIRGNGRLELSVADKVTVIAGVRELETTAASSILRFLETSSEDAGCHSPEACDSYRRTTRASAELWRTYEVENTILPFELWEENDWDKLNECCTTCQSSMRVAHTQAKQALWDRLPQIFGLPDWKTLEEEKAEALK
ncbi:hypothetical protein DFH06DRAFT_1093814 [Mycena polygramma]|nr:hypothetical protein DFH06DRAFT_1093814 [Mycena polygramma]